MSECASRKAATSRRRWGFLARLFRDRRGNTLAIVGAAMIPLAAMIGSGVDMSRAYMAKTRLQSACDAAALAGRRVMQNDSLGTNVEPEARRFFHFNFPKTTTNGVTTGPYQTAEIVNPTVTRPAAGTVRVSASTTIPTSVMRMFGFTDLAAQRDLRRLAQLRQHRRHARPRRDRIDGRQSQRHQEDRLDARRGDGAVRRARADPDPAPGQRPQAALRRRSLFEHGQCRPADSGAVPVPVGGGLPGNPAYLADNATYSSRVANYDEPHATYVGTPQAPEAPVAQTYGSSISQSDCDKYGRNVDFIGLHGQRHDRRRPGADPHLDAGLSRTTNRTGSIGAGRARATRAGRIAAAAAAMSRPTPPTRRSSIMNRAAGSTRPSRSTSASTSSAIRSRSRTAMPASLRSRAISTRSSCPER